MTRMTSPGAMNRACGAHCAEQFENLFLANTRHACDGADAVCFHHCSDDLRSLFRAQAIHEYFVHDRSSIVTMKSRAPRRTIRIQKPYPSM